LDLQLLAFQSDLTRVISFMIGKEQSARPYPQIGVPEAHHPLSHHNDIPELVAHMSKINRYHTELFAQYLARLRATPDGNLDFLGNNNTLFDIGDFLAWVKATGAPLSAAMIQAMEKNGGRP